ncbi:hypothetical protein ACIOML_11850 [Streptomyces anulatus]
MRPSAGSVPASDPAPYVTRSTSRTGPGRVGDGQEQPQPTRADAKPDRFEEIRPSSRSTTWQG